MLRYPKKYSKHLPYLLAAIMSSVFILLRMYNFQYCIIVPHEMEQEKMISCGCYDPDTNCEKTASLRNHSRANPLSLQSYIAQVLSI